MLADVDIPSPLIPLLKLLSRRKTRVRVGEGGKPEFHWIVVANADGRERVARDALQALDELNLLVLEGALDEGFCVRSTETGREALTCYFTGPNDPLVRWRAIAAGSFHPHWDERIRSQPLPEIGAVSWQQQLQAHRNLYDNLASLDVSVLTLRQLSARFFWGDSKYLENLPAGTLNMIYAEALEIIKPRCLMVHVALGASANLPLLLVENQDSFQALSDWQLPYHLVYLAGFKGTALRMRAHSGVKLYYDRLSDKSLIAAFEQRWFSDAPLEAFFWGDLDYSAITMLNALLRWLPGLKAWQPGYLPMVQALGSCGHPAGLKGGQSRPVPTGSKFVDKVLLPAIQKWDKFLDQEWIDISLLTKGLNRR